MLGLGWGWGYGGLGLEGKDKWVQGVLKSRALLREIGLFGGFFNFFSSFFPNMPTL